MLWNTILNKELFKHFLIWIWGNDNDDDDRDCVDDKGVDIIDGIPV